MTGWTFKRWNTWSPEWPNASGYDDPSNSLSFPQRPRPSAAVILYEYPFNERIRTYLRLEQLFRRLGELVSRSHALDHHYALQTIFEIMDVASRADMKSDVLKDIDRQKQQLNSYRGNPAISEHALDGVIAHLDECFSALNQLAGKTGQSLTESDWLMSIRSRIGIPGGTCEFDLPAYYHWQHQSVEKRQADLQRWAVPFGPLAEAIVLLLKMLRDSGSAQKVVAPAGQFQQNLPQGRTFQLLRLRIDPAMELVPEISGNRLMMSVRLLRMGEDERMHPAQEDAAFELTLCA
jgi:cell division protein ZapD